MTTVKQCFPISRHIGTNRRDPADSSIRREQNCRDLQSLHMSVPHESGQPSRTSILVAAARAFGSRDPDAGVRNPDTLADKLIGEEELTLIGDHPLSKGLRDDYAKAVQVPAIALFTSLMILRTRFVDATLQRSIDRGVNQVVILGAGFDSRAYRFRDALKNCSVFEVDARTTQEYKRRRARVALGRAPSNLAYVAVNFEKDDILAALLAAGFHKGERSFFIWEGVSMYLPEESVQQTLRMISAVSAVGSTVVLDYATCLGVELANRSPQGPIGLAAAWGEPWIFGVPDDTGQQFFRGLGFDPGAPLSLNSPEAMKRFATRQDGTTYAAHVIERMKTEAQAKAKLGDKRSLPPEALKAQQAVAAAGGVYWITELTVLP